MKTRYLIWVLAIAIPFSVFLQVTQAYEFQKLSNEIREEKKVAELVEQKNNQLRIGIGILNNPSRIDQIAKENLGLSIIESSRIIKVRIPENLESGYGD